MDHVCNAPLGNTLTEGMYPAFLVLMVVASALGPAAALPRSAAIAPQAMVILTVPAAFVLMVKPQSVGNLSAVQSTAAAVMARSASAVLLTTSSRPMAACNAPTTHIPKEEMVLTA